MNGMLYLCLNSFLYQYQYHLFYTEDNFSTVRVNLWKSKSPVSNVQEFWKLRGVFVKIKSTHERLVGVLQYVGLSKKFLKLCIWQKLFIASSVGSELKSPNRRKLSYFDECESISVLIHFKYPLILVLWGL